MRWVRRGLWTAAWGAWAALGMGLYRELPRDYGPPICKLPVHGTHYAKGFLDDGRRFATCTGASWRDPKEVFVWDARTGELLQRVATPPPNARTSTTPEWLRVIRSCLVGFGHGDLHAGVDTIDWILDLDSGRILDMGQCDRAVFHSARPLVVFFSWQLKSGVGRRIAASAPALRLVDLATGECRLKWPNGPSAAASVTLAGKPIFLGNDRLAIPARRGEEHCLEIWSLDAPSSPLQIVSGVKIESECVGGSDQRIAWQTGSSADQRVYVYDLRLGREVLDAPTRVNENEMEVRTAGWEPMLRLNSSGGGLLSPNFSALWDVDAGRVAWRGGYGLMQATKNRPGRIGCFARAEIDCEPVDRFEAVETWYCRIGSWSAERGVFAVRRLRDAALLYRCWRPTTKERVASQDGKLAVDEKWNVYELPPRPNWALLALCQAILALPHVLTWLVLRWRRRRLQRLAVAMP